MKKRWRLLTAVGVVAAVFVLLPVGYIEGACRAPLPGAPDLPGYRSPLPAGDRRLVAKTFLTYPEWHIVYEADAYARHLATGGRPSDFDFGEQVNSFWTSYCAVNRITNGSAAAGDAKVTIYTIGISYTAELAVKAVYEKTIGRLFEWLGGWTSADDRYAASVQRDYGTFLHETPWYRFPFGKAFTGEWQTSEPVSFGRHWERRVALSLEYGVKAAYAKLIDAATGATVGRDELTLRFVVRGDPAAVASLDARLKPVGSLPGGLTVVEAPRYQQFNDLLMKLAASPIQIVDIAGNDTIFLTILLPAATTPPGAPLLTMPVDRPGWRRVGIAVKVASLLDTIRRTQRGGGIVEHVYDY